MAFCIHCGTQLPEGAAACPRCGAAVAGASFAGSGANTETLEEQTVSPGMSFQQSVPEDVQQAAGQAAQSYQGFQQGPYAQQSQNMYAQQGGYAQGAGYATAPYANAQWQQPKKSKKGLIIGLSVGGGVLLIGVIILILFLTGVIGGKSGPSAFAGSWRFHSMEVMGMTITADTLGMFGADEVADMRVDISESGMVSMNVMGYSQSLQGQFNGNRLTVANYGGESIDFVIEGGNLVFEMDYEGINSKFIFSRT